MSGIVVWVTGLPSSGKSTFARAVLARLVGRKQPACLLDGDEVRKVLVPAPGYDAASRETFYLILARLAALLAHQGLVVLVAATAHRARYRKVARELAPRFAEVYVATSLEECRLRDGKGLWSQADQGSAPLLPGVGAVYEAPENPTWVARGGQDPGAIESVVAALA